MFERLTVSTQRPNILLIHSDQHRQDCLGINGHPLVKTPHLDRLAREGVNFTHAFTPTAICSPARASLMTGVWPTQHRCLSIPPCDPYRPADPKLPVWSTLLRDAGYWMGYAGKFHQELTGTPLDHGFHEYHSQSGYARWRQEQGIPAVQPRSGPFGYFGDVDVHASPEQTFIGWCAARTSEMIERAVGRGEPFCVRWDPPEPHLPCMPPEPFASMYDPRDVPPWPSFGDPLKDKPYIQRQQLRTWKVQGWTWKDWQRTVALYLGVISHIDQQIGRVLDVLDRLGVADNTLVLYSADHGDLCGGHGMMDKHFVMYDDVMRVPMIARWPGELNGGAVCDEFVTNEMDMAATLCGAAGVPVPATFVGTDLCNVATGRVRRDAVYGQWTGAQLGLFTQRMVRDRQWKYIWNATDVDELYDLHADAGELRNRAADPACAEVLASMRRRLVNWMDEVRDPAGSDWVRVVLLEGNKL